MESNSVYNHTSDKENRIGRHEVLLSIYHNYNKTRAKRWQSKTCWRFLTICHHCDKKWLQSWYFLRYQADFKRDKEANRNPHMHITQTLLMDDSLFEALLLDTSYVRSNWSKNIAYACQEPVTLEIFLFQVMIRYELNLMRVVVGLPHRSCCYQIHVLTQKKKKKKNSLILHRSLLRNRFLFFHEYLPQIQVVIDHRIKRKQIE